MIIWWIFRSNSEEIPNEEDVLASTQTIPPEKTSSLPIEVDDKKEEKINGIGSTEAINPKDKMINKEKMERGGSARGRDQQKKTDWKRWSQRTR